MTEKKENSQNANLDPPHSPLLPASPPVPNANANDLNEFDNGFNNNIPLADPSIWDKLLQHQYHNEISNNTLHPTPKGTATWSKADNPEELDNISVETLSDYLGNIDMAACGLSSENIMDAEDIVKAVVEAYTLLKVEDIHNLSLFDLIINPSIVQKEPKYLLLNNFVHLLVNFWGSQQSNTIAA
ncbi:hypothetical protein RhiTH_011050 [Rhizoctonia solani]